MKKPLFILLLVFVAVTTSLLAGGEADYESISRIPGDTLIDRARRMMKSPEGEEDAIKYMTVLIGKYSASSDSHNISLAVEGCVDLGQILFDKELYAESFRFLLQGVRIAESNGITEFVPELYKNIGNIYDVYGEPDLAVKNYKKALRLAREIHDSETELRTLCNLSGICASMGRTAEARIYYRDMMALGGDKPLIRYFGFLAGALIAQNSGNFPGAEKNYRDALDLAVSEKFEPRYVAAVYSELANAFKENNQPDSARFYFEKNRHFCSDNNLVYEQRANLKALIDLYSAFGQKSLSDEMRNEYYLLQDSLMSMDKYTRIKDSEMVSEMEKCYAQISALSQESVKKETKIRRQRTILWIIAAFLLIAFVAVWSIYMQKRRLDRTNRHLYLRNTDLIHKEKEYDDLMRKYDDLKERYASDVPPVMADMSAITPENHVENEQTVAGIPDDMVESIKEKVLKVMADPENFCGSDFQLEKLAEMTGCNPRYVSQVINVTQKKNFRSFVNEYRINEAQKRLMDQNRYGHITIRAIGEEIGFKSYANFIETFRKVTGMTPSDYRKIAIKETRRSESMVMD